MLCLMGGDGAEGYEEVLRSDRECQAVPGGEVPQGRRAVAASCGWGTRSGSWDAQLTDERNRAFPERSPTQV